MTLFIIPFHSVVETSANEVVCEQFGDFFHQFSPYSSRHAIYKTCFMNDTAVINFNDFAISSVQDESIARLDFFTNRNIFYLPVNVSESFPKLSFYNAQNCSIKAISKENFEGLFELKKLYLDNNEIAKIPSDIFDDLGQLEWLTLGENKNRFLSKNVSPLTFNEIFNF